MMAGHPVIPRAREHNGRHQREPELTRKQMTANRSVVLAQPHRAGDLSQHRIWPIGRMILDNMIRDRSKVGVSTMLQAAERYSQAWARVRWLMDSGRPYAVAEGGARRPPAPQERADIERAWGDIGRALRDAAPNGMAGKAMHTVIVDLSPEFEVACLNPWMIRACEAGIAALVDLWEMRS